MKVTVHKGESLWEAMSKMNMVVERPCGGNGSCGGCLVEVEKYGKVKACQFRLAGEYQVKRPQKTAFESISILEEEMPRAQWNAYPVIAVDLGTTTVACYGVYEGQVYRRGFVNPQRIYGADVMSRIKAADQGKLSDMNMDITERLDAVIQDILAEMQEKNQKAVEGAWVILNGNTTMLHIYNGWPVEGLGRYPFQPESLDQQEFDGYLLDLSGIEGLDTSQMGQARFHKIHLTEFPGISAFVGADIVSGIYAMDLLKSEEIMLLIDLGTNGEMALGNKDRLLVTSTAAGPAFEASELALQIHGSGILQCLKEMKLRGLMDESGLICQEYFESGVPVEELMEENQAVSGLSIKQEDIRNLQMAKSAIRSGIEILLKEYNISAKQVSKVFLAGGMGYYLDPEAAVLLGLLPEEFQGKTIAAGNTSLLGAIAYLQRDGHGLPENEEIALDEELLAIQELAEEIALANHPDFEDYYLKYMNF